MAKQGELSRSDELAILLDKTPYSYFRLKARFVKVTPFEFEEPRADDLRSTGAEAQLASSVK